MHRKSLRDVVSRIKSGGITNKAGTVGVRPVYRKEGGTFKRTGTDVYLGRGRGFHIPKKKK